MRKISLAAALLIASIAGASAGCDSCGKSDSSVADSGLGELGQAPAPASLLAEITIPSPNVAWSKLQRAVGGALGLFPPTTGGLACMLAGIDPGLGPEIDGASPVYAALSGDPSDPAFAIALKLVDLRRARDVLVDADTARFTAKEDGDVTELLPKGGAITPAVSVGLARPGYVILARNAGDLTSLAPYLVRTMPVKTVPPYAAFAEVPASATRVVVQSLTSLWTKTRDDMIAKDKEMRDAHGGRAPDFGDPEAIVATADAFVTRRLAELSDLAKAKLAVEVSDEGVRAVLSMTPEADGGPASAYVSTMKTGDATPLLGTTGDAELSILVRDDKSERAGDAKAVEDAVGKALGSRLTADDARALHSFATDFSASRGDVVTIAATRRAHSGILVVTEATDPDAMSRAMKSGEQILRAPAVRGALGAKDVRATTQSGGVAPVNVVTLVPAAMPATAKQPLNHGDLGFAWTLQDHVFACAIGDDPFALFTEARTPSHKLGDDHALEAALRAVGDGASFVLLAQPLKLDPSHLGAPPAPIVISWGKVGGDATLRIDATSGLLKGFAKRQLGL